MDKVSDHLNNFFLDDSVTVSSLKDSADELKKLPPGIALWNFFWSYSSSVIAITVRVTETTKATIGSVARRVHGTARAGLRRRIAAGTGGRRSA